MENETVDINRFVVAMLESAHRQLKQATDGLTDEQLHYRPSLDTNSIAWLAWHLSRWKDQFAANAVGEPQAWVSEGWAERFGLGEDSSGFRDTAEQVAAFKPGRDLLLGYVDAAQASMVDRVAGLSPERMVEPRPYVPGGNDRPVWESLVSTTMDFAQHTGQIAYLRGLISGMGWR